MKPAPAALQPLVQEGTEPVKIISSIAGQLLRCGTSPVPNYGEARGAESTRDFIHKLGIVLKELNESGIWLEIIKRSEMLALAALQPLMQEGTELARIISASIRTASNGYIPFLVEIFYGSPAPAPCGAGAGRCYDLDSESLCNARCSIGI